MNHADHVNLIKDGLPAGGGEPVPNRLWADFGSGTGAFTLALAELLDESGVIYSVDKDRGALDYQARIMGERFPRVAAHYRVADFTRPLQLPPLDGIVVANALHFQRDKDRVAQLLRSYLKPGGRLIVVEYNVDSGNFAVPHPISFPNWQALARRIGFGETRLLATRPSRFLKEFYAAVSY